MKKTVLLIFVLTTFLISCKKEGDVNLKVEITPKEIIKKNITKKLKESFNNPNSFEFVSMKITDSLSVKERRGVLTSESVKETLESEYSSEQMKFLVKNLDDFLSRQTDENKDAVYYVEFIARGTNSFNAIVKNEYSATVLNDKNYTVLMLK